MFRYNRDTNGLKISEPLELEAGFNDLEINTGW
jgi:hypothetical protein